MSTTRRRWHSRPCPALRVAVAALLLTSVALEILPFGLADSLAAAPGERGERTCFVEPLQLCDDGAGFEGFLYDLPVLVPGAPGFVPPAGALVPVAGAAPRVPEGFRPAIDHPPQLPA